MVRVTVARPLAHQAAAAWMQGLAQGNRVTAFEQAATFVLPFRGHRLHGRRGGQGPALFLIHGFPTSGRDWRGVWPALARTHELFALDMLGFGASDKPRDAAYSIAASADQWEALAAATGVVGASVTAMGLISLPVIATNGGPVQPIEQIGALNSVAISGLTGAQIMALTTAQAEAFTTAQVLTQVGVKAWRTVADKSSLPQATNNKPLKKMKKKLRISQN